MQTRSNTWIQLAVAGNAALIASVWIDGVLYPSTTAPAISRAAFPDSISLGNCVSATLQVTVRTDDGDSIAKAAPVVVKMKLQQDSTESEDLDAGTFFISRRSFDRVNNLLTLQCYDAMMKGNAAFPLIGLTEADFPMAMTEAIGYAAGKLGVTVDSRTWDYIQTGDDYVISYPLGLSVKDVLGYIGSANGGNWIITPENKLRFVPVHGYSATGAASIEAVLSKINKNPSFTISRIVIRDKDGNEYMAGDSTGYVLDLGENPYATQGICNDLFAMLGGIEYLPFSISQGIYDPALEIGDCVSYGDDLEAVVYEESVTYNVAFRGNISAPQDAELEDEFPYMSPVKNLERDVTALDAKVDTKASYTDLAAVRIVVNAISADYLKASEAELTYATINLANVVAGSIKTAMIDTGAVQTAQIADGSITDAKIVALTANKITAGTLSVERLEIRGSNTSLVYALNNITGALQSQNVNTINGEVLTQRTVTADRIVANAITANEIAAGTITGNEIAASTITAGKLNVTTLSAITANMGTITGGLLQLGTNAVTELKNDGTGHIGAWNFDATKLYNGTYGSDNSVYFSTANMASKTIGGRTGADWRLTIGSNFGVTNTGAVYSSALYASGGEIGGWTIGNGGLSSSNSGSLDFNVALDSANGTIDIKSVRWGDGITINKEQILLHGENGTATLNTAQLKFQQSSVYANPTYSTIKPNEIIEAGTSLVNKYALKSVVDELNTNLSSLITTRSYGLPGVAVNAYATSDYVFDIGMANYTPIGIITAWVSAGYQCTVVGTAISGSTATVRVLNAYNITRTPSDVWITVLYKHS